MGIRYIDKPSTSSRVRYVDSVDSPKSDEGLSSFREQIEPGIMGETSPTGQRLLENAAIAGAGYTLPRAIQSVGRGINTARLSLAEKSPVLKGILKSPKELSLEFELGKKASGISGDLPVRRGSMTRFPDLAGKPSTQPPVQTPMVSPISYPRDANSFINFARSRVQGLGKKLSPQELDDYKEILGEMFRKGEIIPGTDQYAVASKLASEIRPLHNAAIGGREALNKAYGISKTLRLEGPRKAIAELAKRYGKRAAEGLVLGGAGAYAAKKVFQP